MKISKLIAILEQHKATLGDVEVMTPGFDESGYDLVDSVWTQSVIDTGFCGHGGRFESPDRARTRVGEPITAVIISF
ncbi:hypothetical protein [Paraburkholderia sp.]|uniref:hypothetical protein n=1 Tax=Paraburkholderia sp. TaxID=1926495 RepID=UPI0039E606B9